MLLRGYSILIEEFPRLIRGVLLLEGFSRLIERYLLLDGLLTLRLVIDNTSGGFLFRVLLVNRGSYSIRKDLILLLSFLIIRPKPNFIVLLTN